MLFALAFHPTCKERVGDVVVRAWVWAKLHERFPHAAAKTRLLHELASRRRKRLLAILYHSGRYLPCHAVQAMTILPFKDIAAITCRGYNVNPVGVFERPVVVLDTSVGQQQFVFSHRHPRFFHNILRRKRLPSHLIVGAFQFYRHLILLLMIQRCCYSATGMQCESLISPITMIL